VGDDRRTASAAFRTAAAQREPVPKVGDL
jgi:hypothetical protein